MVGITMANTVRYLPTAMIFADNSVMLSSKAVNTLATTLIASTVAKVNAAITEINLYYWLYGFGSTPNIPQLPAIPTVNPAANGIFYQSQPTPLQAGMSQILNDGQGQTSGYNQPSASLDAILREPNLAAINQALINIAAGKS